MAQKIKFSLYGFLFRFFSFFADKTGGNIFFVKPKVLLGSLVLGLSSGLYSQVPVKSQSKNKNDVQSKLQVKDTIQSQLESKDTIPSYVNTNRPPEVFCYHVEQSPQFPGGEKALLQFIHDNLKYPTDSATCYQGIAGRVVLKFVVTEDGSLSDIQVVKSLDPACDREAIRVVELMPKWIPGKQLERVCRVYYNLPISFDKH